MDDALLTPDVALALFYLGMSAQLVVDGEGRIVRATRAAGRLLGQQLSGASLVNLAAPEERTKFAGYLLSLQSLEPGPLSAFTRCAFLRGDGRTLWVQIQGVNAIGVAPIDGMILTLEDVTTYLERERELQKLSHRDALTGLPNRLHFMEQIKERSRERVTSTVGLLDLDQFKAVNDRHGHAAGDQLLCVIADRLISAAPPGSVIVRLGGDEFGFIFQGEADEAMRARVDSIRQRLSEAIVIGGTTYAPGLSIGLASLRGDKPEQSMRDSDVALYAAKARGRGQTALFGEDAMEIVQGARSLASKVDELLASNRKLHKEARTDALTGLPNRRALVEVEPLTVGDVSSTWSACAICFIDIDHFGRFNKRYGDRAGDDALRMVAQRLRHVAREGDLVYRKGGKEFIAILPNTDYRVALGVGERMREAIHALRIRHGDSEAATVVTVSISVVGVRGGESVGAAVARVGDAAMAAKTMGWRNRVNPAE